jgi:hypothetical protein
MVLAVQRKGSNSGSREENLCDEDEQGKPGLHRWPIRVLLNEANEYEFPEWWNERDLPPQGCRLEIHGNDHMFRIKDCRWEQVEWFACTNA